ncbi:MAG: hypothetical protein ABFC18_03245 [Rikenellaceae bacterium]
MKGAIQNSMRNVIFVILQKHYGKLGANITASAEIAEMIEQFITFRELNATIQPLIIDGEIHYLFQGMEYTIQGLFEFWDNKIRKK